MNAGFEKRWGTVKYLNLGCGNRYHPAWINIDVVPAGPEVIAHDLRRGIPLADDSYDVVYHSHLLEHLRRPDALGFMRECYRVLRPGGILRVAVPDLERLCQAYLDKLEGALNQVCSADDYEWMMIELYDQTVRERSGGDMRAFLARSPLPNETFVLERIGEEGREIIQSFRQDSHDQINEREAIGPRLINSVRYHLGSLLDGFAKQMLALTRGAQARRALEIGTFRLAGEVHQWMYDRYSLGRLMEAAGFQFPRQRSATESQIPDWSGFNLDALPDGRVIKPDSLFMEATKPT